MKAIHLALTSRLGQIKARYWPTHNLHLISRPMPPSLLHQQLIEFLQQELSLSTEAIAIAYRHQEPTIIQLPILLWHYGLITLQQLDTIFDWLETAPSPSL